MHNQKGCNNKKNAVIISAIFFIVIPFLFVSCDISKPQKTREKKVFSQEIRIAVSKTPLSTPFYIAEEKGFFADEGVNVKTIEYIGGDRCLKALLEDEVDLATASDLPIIFNSFKRDDYAVAATFVTSTNDVKIITKKGSGIVSGADLKGKKIGVITGASSQFFLDIYLLNNFIDPADVEMIHINPEDMPEALNNGQVNALSVWEPYGYETVQLLGDDAVILPNFKTYRETFNLISQREFIKTNPEILEKILLALDRAILFIHQNKEDTQYIIKKKLNKNDEFIKWVWKDFSFNLILDQTLILTLEDEARWAITNRLTDKTKVPNYLDYIYFDALEKVAPEAITIIH